MFQEITQRCYRLPWKKDNNPNGWIEPTTYCQLKCPGCYRGIDQENHEAVHEDLEVMKSQVDWLIANRNIQTLSIAGGEPLLYPHILELVDYAYSKNLRTMIYTNGIGLDRKKLRAFKESGAIQFLIHIDRYQNRTPNNTIKELIELRQQYCTLFRSEPGVHLGFIQPLTLKCLETLSELNHFFTVNRDVVNLIVYTLYREICWYHIKKPVIDTTVTMQDVFENLYNNGFIFPSSFLPGTQNKEEPAWLFSYSVGTKSKKLGFIRPEAYAFIQKRYYKKHKRYLFISKSNDVQVSGLFKLFFKKGIGRIILSLLFQPWLLFRSLHFQTYLIIRGPEKREIGWDLCEGCPDAMLYNGKPEPSCILEDIKKNREK